MPVTISTHITIEGANVDDAKRQLIALFGVSLGQVVFAAGADDPKPVLLASSALTPPPNATAAGQANLAAQPLDAAEPPARRRRTKAEMTAAQAGAAIESAPEPAPTAPVNGAAAAEAEEEIDLLSCGHAGNGAVAEEDVDPLADEPPAKPKTASSRTLTKADMMDAGKAVLDKHGMQKLTDILKQHGHTRVAALAEHSYPAVMADFEEALA